jgi:phospholipase/carboxylesterase
MREEQLGGLRTRVTGGTDGKGGGRGPLVLLLHGFGAPGDMARIEADRAAGRARDLSQDIPKGLAPARQNMLTFLKEVEQKFGADPRKTILGGFSQGAMLSCDALLHTDRPYAGLIQLSGNLLAQPVWGPLMQKRKGLPVFQSHGMQDEILPYVGGERLREALSKSGLTVEWHSFRGGHEIPEPVLRALSVFLRTVLGKS